MLGSVSSNFADIMIIEESIKLGLKSEKISHGLYAVTNPKRSRFNPGRKEGDVQATSIIPHYCSCALPVPNNLYHQSQKGK